MEHHKGESPNLPLGGVKASNSVFSETDIKTKPKGFNNPIYKAKSPKKQPARSTHAQGKTGRKNGRKETTQAEVKLALEFEPATGEFTWLIDRGRYRCKGKNAGTSTAGGYVSIELDGMLFRRSRLAYLYMTGEWPPAGYYVDHVNRVKSDDRWDNLRLATPAENSRNRTPCARNKSGFVGVCWSKQLKKWEAFISINKKCASLGFFAEFDAACDARIAAEIEHYGEFSRRVA